MIRDLVLLILHGAVCTHRDAYSPEFTDAMRQLHWAFHDVESRFTRHDAPVDQVWMDGDYALSRWVSS